jgi:hypothetical protein
LAKTANPARPGLNLLLGRLTDSLVLALILAAML